MEIQTVQEEAIKLIPEQVLTMTLEPENVTVAGNITLDGDYYFVGTSKWSHYNYPAACPANSAVTQLDDSVTCSDYWIDETGDVMTGNLTVDGNLSVTQKIGIGTTAPSAANLLEIRDPNDAGMIEFQPQNGEIGFYRVSAGSNFAFYGGRGTLSNPTTTQNGDDLGGFFFKGVDSGNNRDVGGQIICRQDGASGTRVPTALLFKTSTSTAALQERMRITSAGNIGIGTTAPASKLDVKGNINASGNITAQNTFLPQYIYSHTNETISVLGANTWTNVTISQEDSDIKQGITHTWNDNTNHTFTIGMDGIYDVNYDFDVTDTSAGASDIDVAARLIYASGTEIKGSVFESDITKQGVEVELSHSFLAEFNSSDVIVFQFTATDADIEISTHGTFGDYPESASIRLFKVANLPK